MSPLQTQTEQRGMEIFRLVDRHPESIFSKSGFYQRMMALSMKDEHFKVQMFRFVDVLASIHRPKDIVQHFDEYLSTVQNAFAPMIRPAIKLSHMFPFIAGPFMRWNVSGMARQFIAGRDPQDVMKMLRKRR